MTIAPFGIGHGGGEMASPVAPWLVALAAWSLPATALAFDADDGAQPEDGNATWPQLDPNPGMAIGMDVYSGLVVLAADEEGVSHAFVGGLARLRWRYLQVAGFYETTDEVQDRWQTVGGLVGTVLPFVQWVDFDASIGLASRRYINSDTRYGPSGYDLPTRSIAYRIGVSDRSTERTLGVRVGAQIVGSIDLERHDVAWRYVMNEGTVGERVIEGVATLGGVSVGLQLVAGFDVAPATRRGHF